ncbi:MAG: hypothetical protein ACI3XR_06005 [Eubacteriales bacterium]
MKKTAICLAGILLVSTLTLSCTGGDKPAETTGETEYINPDKWDTVRIYRGIWYSRDYDEDTMWVPPEEDGYYCPENIGYDYPDAMTTPDLQRSMRTASYTKTEVELDICEYVQVCFFRDGKEKDRYVVTYYYDYLTEKVYCRYEQQLYLVSDYDLLVSDLVCLTESYTYDKYISVLWESDDESEEGGHDIYELYYTKFFARDTGFDPSTYSGFLNTDPVDGMTEDVAIALAKAEAERLGYSGFMVCAKDPFTGYWLVEFSDDSPSIYYDYVQIFMNEAGQTIQITPCRMTLS